MSQPRLREERWIRWRKLILWFDTFLEWTCLLPKFSRQLWLFTLLIYSPKICRWMSQRYVPIFFNYVWVIPLRISCIKMTHHENFSYLENPGQSLFNLEDVSTFLWWIILRFSIRNVNFWKIGTKFDRQTYSHHLRPVLNILPG